MSIFFHETLHRGPEALARARDLSIAVCGAGAIGANVVETLARSGVGALRVVDCDRVEERNLSTQPYGRADVGAFKAKVLANGIYRAVGTAVDARAERLTPANASKLLDGAALVVDAFDNSTSRAALASYAAESGVACVHAGLVGGYAEVIWNEEYRVPSAANDDVCDYPLARTLALLAATVACEVAIDFATTGRKRSYTITLEDLAVTPF